MFLIPLSTNRYYTHEIIPPTLPVDKIPTRLGYVIRCSNTEAFHKDGVTYIKGKDEDFKLEEPTESDRAELKALYLEENTTYRMIDYGDVLYSLNEGDYKKPSM